MIQTMQVLFQYESIKMKLLLLLGTWPLLNRAETHHVFLGKARGSQLWSR